MSWMALYLNVSSVNLLQVEIGRKDGAGEDEGFQEKLPSEKSGPKELVANMGAPPARLPLVTSGSSPAPLWRAPTR